MHICVSAYFLKNSHPNKTSNANTIATPSGRVLFVFTNTACNVSLPMRQSLSVRFKARWKPSLNEMLLSYRIWWMLGLLFDGGIAKTANWPPPSPERTIYGAYKCQCWHFCCGVFLHTTNAQTTTKNASIQYFTPLVSIDSDTWQGTIKFEDPRIILWWMIEKKNLQRTKLAKARVLSNISQSLHKSTMQSHCTHSDVWIKSSFWMITTSQIFSSFWVKLG